MKLYVRKHPYNKNIILCHYLVLVKSIIVK